MTDRSVTAKAVNINIYHQAVVAAGGFKIEERIIIESAKNRNTFSARYRKNW